MWVPASGPVKTLNPDTCWGEEADKQRFFFACLFLLLFSCVFFFFGAKCCQLTARAKWLGNTLMLFRGCEDTAPFTGLMLQCLLSSAVANSPRVHGKVTSLQKRKWEECVKTNFQSRKGGVGEKKSTYRHFSSCNSEPGRPEKARLHSHLLSRQKMSKWSEIIRCFFFLSKAFMF